MSTTASAEKEKLQEASELYNAMGCIQVREMEEELLVVCFLPALCNGLDSLAFV